MGIEERQGFFEDLADVRLVGCYDAEVDHVGNGLGYAGCQPFGFLHSVEPWESAIGLLHLGEFGYGVGLDLFGLLADMMRTTSRSCWRRRLAT